MPAASAGKEMFPPQELHGHLASLLISTTIRTGPGWKRGEVSIQGSQVQGYCAVDPPSEDLSQIEKYVSYRAALRIFKNRISTAKRVVYRWSHPTEMRLHLVRHGDARDHADDEKRELSRAGFEQARAMGRFLRAAGVQFEAAYTSPLIRARQTSGVLLAELNMPYPPPQFTGALLNSTGLEDFHHWLGQLTGKDILLVGHEPTLSERVRSLLTMSAPGAFSMAKGACVGIRTTDGRHGRLLYHVTPQQLGI